MNVVTERCIVVAMQPTVRARDAMDTLELTFDQMPVSRSTLLRDKCDDVEIGVSAKKLDPRMLHFGTPYGVSGITQRTTILRPGAILDKLGRRCCAIVQSHSELKHSSGP